MSMFVRKTRQITISHGSAVRQEWSHLWHHKPLNVSLLAAFHDAHSFPRHSHDYYVVAVVDRGLQSFSRGNEKYITPVDGLILLNPGDVHTGEPVDERGFAYRALYPTVEHMTAALGELDEIGAPDFHAPRVDDPQMAARLRALFAALRVEENLLEAETRFLMTLVDLAQRFGGKASNQPKIPQEHAAVGKVRDYIHEHYAEPISLTELAVHVNFSRYYLVRTFRNAVGMPPHLYLETVRIREAQRLLSEGETLAQAAYLVGFSSQSHFTQRFKKIIGVTPGVYAGQLRG